MIADRRRRPLPREHRDGSPTRGARRRRIARGPLCACALLAAGCSAEATDPIAALMSPRGLAVAGTVAPRLFVSSLDEDVIQVVHLGEELIDAALVLSPAQRLPLRIPAGAGPVELATSMDGRFLVVLDAVTESLRVVDADSLLLVRDADEGLVQLALGSGGSRPTAMVSSAEACGVGCSGRFYVALAGAGAVAGVELVDGPAGPTLGLGRIFAVGGEPSRLAIDARGERLFVTDASTPELVRIDLLSGALERRALGVPGGPIAVSRDGTLVVVGRPRARDVVVFGDAAGPGLLPIDANPRKTPVPECLRRCDESDPEVCAGAHPADLALCVAADASIAAVAGREYGAVYLGEVPTLITTLGSSAGHVDLAATCEEVLTDEETARVQSFSDYAVVALLDGRAMLIGLRGQATDAASPQLVSTRWCMTPAVAAEIEWEVEPAEPPTPQLSRLLGPCPATPPGRNRFACLHSANDPEDAGVVILQGHGAFGSSGSTTWRLAWEGALPGLDRTATGIGAGAGEILADGSFVDLAIDLAEWWIRPCTTSNGAACTAATPPSEVTFWGDLLEITETPLPACDAGLRCTGAARLDRRSFERRIVGIEPRPDGRSRLLLDRPLIAEAACFETGGKVEYRIRAGDAFLVSAPTGLSLRQERLRPGETYGPGGAVGHDSPVIFAVQPFVNRPELSACERYDGDGHPRVDEASGATVIDAVLDRTAPLLFAIDDPYVSFFTAVSIDANGDPEGAAGRLPGAMIVSAAGAFEPVVFLSYTGSNGVLGMVPSRTASPWGEARYRLIR